MLRAADIIRELGLAPHPEGGHFVELFRARREVQSAEHPGGRSASTAIYFLLQAAEFSALHRVRSDEVWHHYLGDPLELHQLGPGGASRTLLGTAFEAGQRPLAVVPAGVLQGARVLPGPRGFALCGCTVAPGFEFRDFEMPSRAALLREHPEYQDLIASLTRI